MSKKTETLEKYFKMLFDHSVRGIKSEIHFQLSSERTEGMHIIKSDSLSSDLEKWYIHSDEGLIIHESEKNHSFLLFKSHLQNGVLSHLRNRLVEINPSAIP